MPRSLEEIIANADELADTFERYDAAPQDQGTVLTAITGARDHRVSWAAIGGLLGTSGEAARQRYGRLVKH